MQDRILYADILRVFATIEVLFLHSASPLLYEFNRVPLGFWWVGNLFDAAVLSCVPLFVMLSGMLLLDPAKDEPVRRFYFKRCRRVAVPLLFWGVIYFAIRILYYKQNFTPFMIAREFLTGPVFYHLWYVYMILLLYLITPALRFFIRRLRPVHLKYILVVWFVFTSITPLTERFLGLELIGKIDGNISYAGYFVLGYCLRGVTLTKRQIPAALALVLLSLAVTTVGTYFLTRDNGGVYDGFFYGYLAPNIVVMSVATFLVLKSLDYGRYVERISGGFYLVGLLAASSFGMYLVHDIFLIILNEGLLINALFVHPVVGIPVTAVITVVLSFLSVLFLKRVPYLRAVVG